MTSKLTLSIDEKVIEAAKKYSAKKGVSLSRLIEDYLTKITSANSLPKTDIMELRGILKDSVPEDFDYKKAVRDHVYEKHVKR